MFSKADGLTPEYVFMMTAPPGATSFDVAETRRRTCSSSFHFSPFGPRPQEGGSMMTRSYWLPLLPSRSENLRASSTHQRMPSNPLNSWLVRVHETTCLMASTWVTSAPAARPASDAPPVYANRLSKRLPGPMRWAIQSQLAPCSGKMPTCLNRVISSEKCKVFPSVKRVLNLPGIGHALVGNPLAFGAAGWNEFGC